MSYPNLQIENKLISLGYKFIAGIDEAGKGSWAGPIVAGAVILDPKIKISGLRDSKLLTPKNREKMLEIIMEKSLAFGLGVVGNEIIDQIGITKANLLAMTQALDNLQKKPDYLLIDAVKLKYHDLPSASIIDGDYKIASIAAASILAKTCRDQIMKNFSLVYSDWAFAQHKGYGTKRHQELICQNGICRLHRTSFKPIKNLKIA